MKIKILFFKIKNLILSLISEDTFKHKFAFTFGGNIINLILQIALSPILSRIYSPEAYGIYAIFNAISLNFALVSSLSYTNAILKAPDEALALRLTRLSIVISSFFSLLALIAFSFLSDQTSAFFELDSYGWLIFIIPFSTFLYNVNISLSALNIFYHKVSKDVTIITSTNIFNRMFNLGYGFFTGGATIGLVLGDVITKIVRVFWLSLNNIKYFKTKVSLSELTRTAKNYKAFPYLILPSSLVSLLSSQLPIFLFTFYFGTTIVGYFSLASSMLLIPIQLFGNSSSSIFFKKATDTYASDGLVGLQAITGRLFFILLVIGIISFGLIMPFGEVIFKFVFGEEWAMAGVFFGYLSFFYIIMLAAQPLNNILLVIHKENQILWLNLVGIILRAISLLPGIYYDDYLLSIKLFSLANFAYYLLFCLVVFKFLKSELKVLIMKITALTSIVVIYYLVVKTFL